MIVAQYKVLLKVCVGVLTRRAWHELVTCCVIPHPGWLMQEVTQERTGLSWFRPRGRTSSKGVCECTVLSCTGGAYSRVYKRGKRGMEAPKSLLEEKLIEASANIGAQESVRALVSCAKCGQ